MELQELSDYLKVRILNRLSYEHALSLCSVSGPFAALCDEDYWRQRAVNVLRVSPEFFNNFLFTPEGKIRPHLAFREVLLRKRCVKGSERYQDIDFCTRVAYSKGDVDLVRYYLSKGATNPFTAPFSGFRYLELAVLNNNPEMVLFILSFPSPYLNPFKAYDLALRLGRENIAGIIAEEYPGVLS